MEKSALYAFKEVLKELQEPDAISSIVVDVDLTAKQKWSVSDLIENAEKETGTCILMFCQNPVECLDFNLI